MNLFISLLFIKAFFMTLPCVLLPDEKFVEKFADNFEKVVREFEDKHKS